MLGPREVGIVRPTEFRVTCIGDAASHPAYMGQLRNHRQTEIPMEVDLTLNDDEVTFEAARSDTLLDVLRDNGYTGAKRG